MWVMYDDVDINLIPASAPAVAGYVDGSWPTWGTLVAKFPNRPQLSIAVHSGNDAHCLDCEPGDASIGEAPSWVKRQLARGVFRPVIYTSASQMRALLNTLESSGITRESVRLWCAHYTGVPHICGPQCGFDCPPVDGTQWTDVALGRKLDESLLLSNFFDPPAPPKPKDPYHYLRFHDQTRRNHVMEYDEKRQRPLVNRKRLKVLRNEMRRGAEVLAHRVIKEAPKAGTQARKAAWAKDHRGWKYQALIHRANGKKVVK